MYISEFATLTGTTPKTIRYYESIGLLPEPKRKGKYRIYDETYIETVKQIKRSQELGFNLSEIKSFMEGVNIKWGLPAKVITDAVNLKRKQLKEEMKKLAEVDEKLLTLLEEMKLSPCNIDSNL